MFCYQCEEADMTGGCKTFGGCGLTEDTARLHDLVMHAAIGYSYWATHARRAGVSESVAGNTQLLEALTSTTTRTNFDDNRLASIVERTVAARDERRAAWEAVAPDAGEPDFDARPLPDAAVWTAPEYTAKALAEVDAGTAGIWPSFSRFGNDAAAAQELCVVGAKGCAAFALQASRMGSHDAGRIDARIQAALSLVGEGLADVGSLVAMSEEMGCASAAALELLDTATTAAFGRQEPTAVTTCEREGKAILVSGDSLHPLRAILEATAGTGVNVYTHGELTAAHGYPELVAAYPHLVSPYGAGWQLQAFDFARFPGPIVVAGTPLVAPRVSYAPKLYTAAESALPGTAHIDLGSKEDLAGLVAAAREADGFLRDSLPTRVVAGYGRHAVSELAAPLAEALEAGKVSQVVVIGGGDSGTVERSWFGSLADELPEDAVILTMGVVKNRLRRASGPKARADTVPGTSVPRLVDLGASAGASSVLALVDSLSARMDRPVSELPVSVALSWHEQRSLGVMLALMSHGIRDMRVGPHPPRFVTSPIERVLHSEYGVTFVPQLSDIEPSAAEVAAGLAEEGAPELPVAAEVARMLAKGHGPEALAAAEAKVRALAAASTEAARAVAAQRRAHEAEQAGRRVVCVT